MCDQAPMPHHQVAMLHHTYDKAHQANHHTTDQLIPTTSQKESHNTPQPQGLITINPPLMMIIIPFQQQLATINPPLMQMIWFVVMMTILIQQQLITIDQSQKVKVTKMAYILSTLSWIMLMIIIIMINIIL
jgi:hypothetical protein